VNVTDPCRGERPDGVEAPRTTRLTPSPEIALCCWTALVTDTGRFSYSNTSPDALRDGAAMLEAGVDPAEAHRMIYENRSSAALALETKVLSRVEVVNGGRVAYTWVKDDDYEATGAAAYETENLVDAVRALSSIDVAVLMREHTDEVRVNLRAKTGFDVAEVAHRFGGGGHTAAAGFTYQGDRDALLDELLPLLPRGEKP
jgi:bifunctional oligoribonuclease and PAP phosphatase NrnA